MMSASVMCVGANDQRVCIRGAQPSNTAKAGAAVFVVVHAWKQTWASPHLETLKESIRGS